MILRDFLAISTQNLWRMKLRTALTVSGVVVGIGALVAMLSFGYGMQKNVSARFGELDLFRTLHVMPQVAADDEDVQADSSRTPPSILDEAAIETFAALDGVRMVYPQQAFEAQVRWDGQTHTAKVQALPASFGRQSMFREMIAGRFFAADTAREAVVSREWLRRMEIEPDSIMGKRLSLRTAGSSELLLGVGRAQLAKLGLSGSLVEIASDVAETILSFMQPNSVTVRVVGIAEIESGFGFRLGSVLVPSGVVSNLDYIAFSDPVELMTMLSEPPAEGWALVVVKVMNERDYDRVSSEIEAMGFRIFSFLEQLDQIRRSFLVFDVIAGAIGLLALFIASLGIVNTMVMSIIERTREIGILKSLGAQEGQVRLLFLVESATIGLVGSLGGILLGWLVSRLLSAVIQWYLASQELPAMDMFSLPLWVALGAIGFGVGVSIVAGLYPASRGARVDPVRALRYE